MKRKILIIGAGGIGSHLVQFLSKLGIYSIYVSDSDSYETNQECYQNFIPKYWGKNKAEAMESSFNSVISIPYDVLTDGQLKGYDLVICCADNLDVRRLVYRQGYGSDSKVKWLDLRAQGRNGILISHLINPSMIDTLLTGPEGSFSCQAENWNGSSRNIDMLHIVMAGIGAQWMQKWFNNEKVNEYMVMNI
jgi:hypothetical protein